MGIHFAGVRLKTPVTLNYLLLEDGTNFLLEDGTNLILD